MSDEKKCTCGGVFRPASGEWMECYKCHMRIPPAIPLAKRDSMFRCEGCLWWTHDKDVTEGMWGWCYGAIPIATGSDSSLGRKFLTFPHTRATNRCPNWQKKNTAPIFNGARNRRGPTGTRKDS